MGDFLEIGFRQNVHKDSLVALIRDPYNWRPGELARIVSIEPEGMQRTLLHLEFSDGEKHYETLCWDRFEQDPSRIPGVYYRFYHSLNGNPAEHTLVNNGLHLGTLVTHYHSLRTQNPHLIHLSNDLLVLQYRLLFSDELTLEQIRAASEIPAS